MRATLASAFALISGLATAQLGPYTRFAPSNFIADQVSIIDLDSDGDADILLAGTMVASTSRRVRWMENDGLGHFTAPMPWYALGDDEILGGIVQADLDGDGYIDLVARSANAPSLSWYRNMGNGSFEMQIDPFSGAVPASFVFGKAFDVDQDGDMDLLLYSGSTLTIAMNSAGPGTFSPLNVINNTITIRDFDMGDADGDGDLDLLYSWRLSSFAYVNAQIHLDGQGTFEPAPYTTMNSGSIYLSEWGCGWMDMDHDGDMDPLAVSGSLYYFPSVGDGTFLPGVNSGLYPGAMRSSQGVDIDADGDQDIVTGSGRHLVEIVFGPTIAINSSVDIGGRIEQTAIGDVDGDGDLDVVVLAASGRTIAWNERIGNAFGPWHGLMAEALSPVDIVHGDLNDDGIGDVVAIGSLNGTVTFYPGTAGPGYFGAGINIDFQADSVLSVGLGDLDGDGDLDIVSAEGRSGNLAWYENLDGIAGSWQKHVFISGLARPVCVALADLDQDGDLDVVFVTHADRLVRYCLNLGGSFAPPALIGSLDNAPTGLALGLLDNNTWIDVAVSGSTGQPGVTLFRAQSGGTTFLPGVLLSSASNLCKSLQIADLDADGDNDLLICEGARVSFFRNTNNGGTFSAQAAITNGTPAAEKAFAGDIDGDGRQDVVALKPTNQGAMWARGLESGGFGPMEQLTTGLVYAVDAAIADVDEDGDLDLLFSGTQWNDIGVVENFFGSPYRISGTLFLDLDASGDQGAGDAPAPFIPVYSTPPASVHYTDLYGDYSLYLSSGAYTVESSFGTPCWDVSTDSIAYHDVLTPADRVRTGRDFGFEATCGATNVLMFHTYALNCGTTSAIDVHLRNIGTTTPQGMLRVVLDPLLVFESSTPPPAQQVADTLWFTLGALGHFEHRNFRMLVTAPGSTQLGDTVGFVADFLAEDDLGDPLGVFSTSEDQVVLCAFDPNDKQVAPTGAGAQGLIPMDTQRLIYTVRFQNTGNAPATTVVIHDHLSPLLDAASIQVIGWTHPFSLRVEPDREALFIFNNIMLPDSGADLLASQGHVIFSIALQPGLPAGTVIENTAGIVFDLNPPVITNTVVNTLYDCSAAVANITYLGSNILIADPGVRYQWALDGVDLPGADQQEYHAIQNGLYTVTVTDTIGCTPTSAPYPFIVTSVEEHQLGSAHCFPDPFTASTTVVLPFIPGVNESLQVHDIHGRLLMRIPATGHSIQLPGSELATGVLMLRYIHNNGSIVHLGKVIHMR